jgi:hypothetical protein
VCVEDFEIGSEKDGMQGKESGDGCKKEVKGRERDQDTARASPYYLK